MEKVTNVTRLGSDDELDPEAGVVDDDELDQYDRMASRLSYESFKNLDDRPDWERALPEGPGTAIAPSQPGGLDRGCHAAPSEKQLRMAVW